MPVAKVPPPGALRTIVSDDPPVITGLPVEMMSNENVPAIFSPLLPRRLTDLMPVSVSLKRIPD